MNGIRRFIDAHFTSFGDIPLALYGQAQWSPEAHVVTRHVPGGNVSYTQNLGRGPVRVTYDLKLRDGDDFANFTRLLGKSATLTLPADIAALPNRTPVVIAGERYDRIADVVLEAIDPGSVTRTRDGIVSCSATFLVAVTDTAIPTPWLGVTA